MPTCRTIFPRKYQPPKESLLVNSLSLFCACAAYVSEVVYARTLSPANQTGAGSADVVFSFDANSGPTRLGTFTIGGQTLTVTQAGSTYVAARPLTTLVSSNLNTPLNVPFSLAVDGAGNVYIADSGDDAIKKWTAASNTMTTFVASGLNGPRGVAVDGAGNVYIADSGHGVIKEWAAASSNVSTLVSSGLSYPAGLAVDDAGNVYVADAYVGAIKEWTAANGNVTTLVSWAGSLTWSVAVDGAGNVYSPVAYESMNHGGIMERTEADGDLVTLVSGFLWPDGVAVDGAGNIYFTDDYHQAIKELTGASQSVTTLVSAVSSGLAEPSGVTVDRAGNVYIADCANNTITELPYAFVNTSPKLEGLAAGIDSLPSVLPATENLLPPFAPTSDQPWLTISGITNGVVSFAFIANTGPARTCHITVLGQSIPITQGVIGRPPTLTGVQMQGNGIFQFSFTNTAGASFTVLSCTNLALPWSNWTVVGAATNTGPDQFQFTSKPITNDPQRFYGVRSP